MHSNVTLLLMDVITYHIHVRQERSRNVYDVFHLFAEITQLASAENEHFFNVVFPEQTIGGDQTDGSRQALVQNDHLQIGMQSLNSPFTRTESIKRILLLIFVLPWDRHTCPTGILILW